MDQKIIKWTNVYSGETGFVKKIKRKERHFVNTKNIYEAKKYTTQDVETAIDLLVEIGEGVNNSFEIINFVEKGIFGDMSFDEILLFFIKLSGNISIVAAIIIVIMMFT